MEPGASNGGGRSFEAPSSSQTLSDQPKELEIYLKVMKTVCFKVANSDTISDVKARFHSMEGIPLNHQQIFFAGNHLKDEKRLADYEIPRASTLHLYLNNEAAIQINIKMPPTGKTITLDVIRWDTIRKIKAMIHAKEGIPLGQQCLLYTGRLLDDSQTLAAYNIGKGSFLNLILNLGDALQIFVSLPNMKTITLDVKYWYTVWDVKAITESITQVSADKHKLVLGATELEDCRSLADYKVENGSTLHLLVHFSTMQILVNVASGKTITLEVKESDDIRKVMCQIEQKVGIPYVNQRLIFGGRLLRKEWTLTDYDVREHSTLNLKIGPHGVGQQVK